MNARRVDLIVFLTFIPAFIASAQVSNNPTDKEMRWQHLGPDLDSVYGIQMDRAYEQLLKGRKGREVIVAIIDSGIDTMHADLKPILWRNASERCADEDANGYRGDRYGWNFLGIKDGNRQLRPGFEYQRTYLAHMRSCSRYTEAEILASQDKKCLTWLSTKERFKADSTTIVSGSINYWARFAREDSVWRKVLGKEIYFAADIVRHGRDLGTKPNSIILPTLESDPGYTNLKLLSNIDELRKRLLKQYSQETKVQRLETIGDDYTDLNDRFYGNSDVTEVDGHGTHVACIVGAVRNNDIGIDGVAEDVRLMPVRVVPPNADEYDKDVALAIRYAVDNGARVINLSFGKQYSPEQSWVNDAMGYATKKDVLIVHAAGNDSNNNDSIAYYPVSKYPNGEYAANVITVGANGMNRIDLIAPFSNYGKASVDVFAPGHKVYSAIRHENTLKLEAISGTSIAAPVVSGLAAVLRSYYPDLTALQVKCIIESSVTVIGGYVRQPGTGRQVPMTDLCRTGGIVNAYKAVQLADKMTKGKGPGYCR